MSDNSWKQRLVFMWAIAATLAAIISAGIALGLFIRSRATTSMQRDVSALSTNSPFPGLRESEVPGKYRWFRAGVDGGTIELKPDHTFANKEGKTLPKFHWELAPDGLLIIWQDGQISRFTKMEKPGVFIFPRPNGQDSRLEKIQENSR